eukprot:14107683-Ditylum_brightwellii.AAC.1
MEDEKQKTLEAVNLLTEKQCGKLKAQTCANGKHHRKLVLREELALSTMNMESLAATLVIDAKEEQDAAFFDIPGTYLWAKMPKTKKVLIVQRGVYINIMCEVNHEYKQFVQYEKGKKMLYIWILKVLYGCIKSAIL